MLFHMRYLAVTKETEEKHTKPEAITGSFVVVRLLLFYCRPLP